MTLQPILPISKGSRISKNFKSSTKSSKPTSASKISVNYLSKRTKIKLIENILKFITSYDTISTLSHISEFQRVIKETSLIISLNSLKQIVTPRLSQSLVSSHTRITDNIITCDLDPYYFKTNADQREQENISKQVVDIDESKIKACMKGANPRFVVIEIMVESNSPFVSNPLDILDNFELSPLLAKLNGLYSCKNKKSVTGTGMNFIHLQIINVGFKQERFNLNNLDEFLDVYKFEMFQWFNYGNPRAVKFMNGEKIDDSSFQETQNKKSTINDRYLCYPIQQFQLTKAMYHVGSSRVKFFSGRKYKELMKRVVSNSLIEDLSIEVILYENFKSMNLSPDFGFHPHFNYSQLELVGLDLCSEDSIRENMLQFNETFKIFLLSYFKYLISINLRIIAYNTGGVPTVKGFDIKSLSNYETFKTFLISWYCRVMFMKPENEFVSLRAYFHSCIEHKLIVKDLKFDFFNLINSLNYYDNDDGFVKTCTTFESTDSFTQIILKGNIIEYLSNDLFQHFIDTKTQFLTI